MIDYNALFKISYGLYVVCAGSAQKGNGFISNTVFQVTSEPARFATCCNKENYSARLITESGAFSVSVLSQDVSSELIGRFGYKSGKDMNKMEGLSIKTGETGIPIVLNDTLAYLECKVIQTIDLGTHLMFIGDLVQAAIVDDNKEPLTYSYYHKVRKGSSPKTAPTYVDPLKMKKNMEPATFKKYECIVCGYVYDDAVEDVPFLELPDDWLCPLCGASKEEFKEI